MKELTFEQAHAIYKGKDPVTAIQEAYRLGQRDAGMDEKRFQASCAALTGMLSAPYGSTLSVITESVAIADALIAELNRTASAAEKGGEG